MTTAKRLSREQLAILHDGLCGVAIGDGECSCLVHWIIALQTEADALRCDMERVLPMLPHLSFGHNMNAEGYAFDDSCTRCLIARRVSQEKSGAE